MSLAALLLLPLPMAPNAFWTPPRHVSRVPMLTPRRKAVCLVELSDELVLAS